MSKLWFSLRALSALSLLVGFYVLALGMAAFLAYIPFAQVVYTNRISPQVAIACLASAFVILRASIFVRPPPFQPPGPELREEEQPELFALIRDVAARMRTRMPARVYAVPEVNAFVAEVGGFMGFGTTRVMGIGLGLLHVDDVSGLRATLAHELGHYAGGDTRLGAIVYRTRVAIGRVLEGLGQSFLKKPFEWYGTLYLRVTHAISRRQELEADRASVTIAGREAHVASLRNGVRGAVLFGAFLRNEVAPLLDAGMCPSALYDGFERFAARAPATDLDAALEKEATDPYDTHPSLADRIAFAEALPDAGVARDARPALAVVRDAPKMERDVETYLFGELGVQGKLRRVPWSTLATTFYAPKLNEDARRTAERLFPLLAAGPRYADVLRAFAAKLRAGEGHALARAIEPEVAQLRGPSLEEATRAAIGRALGLLAGAALVDRGGEWTTEVGEPIAVAIGGALHDPFTRGREALASPDALDAYVASVVDEANAAAS